MNNIFSELNRTCENKRLSHLLYETVPLIKTFAFFHSDGSNRIPANNKYYACIKSSFASGYWVFNLSLHKAKILSANKNFIFGYKHNSELVFIFFSWEKNRIVESNRINYTKNTGITPFKLPFFSEGEYVEDNSKCDITFLKDIITTPKVLKIIDTNKEDLNKLFGDSSCDYLNEEKIVIEDQDYIRYLRINKCIDDIYRTYSEKIIRKHLENLSFDKISVNRKLSKAFIEEHFDYLDMVKILDSYRFSEEFIKKHIDKLDLNIILRTQKLSEEFIYPIKSSFSKENWETLSHHQKLSENFIRNHKELLDWEGISSSQKLSLGFLWEFKDYIKFPAISRKQKLSEKFITEFQNVLDWEFISYQKLSESFILKHFDKLNSYIISRCQNHLSKEFLEKIKMLSYIS